MDNQETTDVVPESRELSPEKAHELIEHLKKESEKYRKNNALLRQELEPLKKTAEEVEAARKAALEEQGRYKELYDKAQTEIAKKAELETRLKAFESSMSEELEVTKKLMSAEEVAMLDDLQLPIEQRLKLAKTLSGKKVPEPSEARGGGAMVGSSDILMKDYQDPKTTSLRKMEILAEIEKTNPTLYKRITA